MRTQTLLIAAFTLATAVACGPVQTPDAYRDVLPDDRVLVNLRTDGAEGARTGEWSEAYTLTAEVTQSVNGTAGFVLGLVDTVTDFPPTWSDDAQTTALWGPWDGGALDPVASQLWVAQDEAGAYTWALQQRPKNDDDAEWVTVVAGQVDAGATAEASRGAFAIDWSAAHALNPTVDPAQGLFYLEYDIGASGVTAEAAFENFLDDNGNPANAVYAYEQVYEGDGKMDLAIESDMDGDLSAKEVLVVRSRWLASGAGRGDAYALGGNFGDFVGTLSDCWGTDFNTSYWVDNFSAKGGFEEGDAATCVFAAPEYDDEGLDEATSDAE